MTITDEQRIEVITQYLIKVGAHCVCCECDPPIGFASNKEYADHAFKCHGHRPRV